VYNERKADTGGCRTQGSDKTARGDCNVRKRKEQGSEPDREMCEVMKFRRIRKEEKKKNEGPKPPDSVKLGSPG